MNFLLYLIPVLLPVTAGALILLLKPERAAKASSAAAVLAGVSAAAVFRHASPAEYRFADNAVMLLSSDRMSVFFIVIIAAGFAAALLFADEYMAEDRGSWRFFGFSLLTLGAMMGLSEAGNILTFYMFYEMMSLLSFPLVAYDGTEKARRAAMVYLGFSVFGACLALTGIILGGSLTLRPFSELPGSIGLSGRQTAAFLLMALGFSCKAGMMPLANWLPVAHPAAPAPASALLSGVITKAGILGMIRSEFYIFGAENLAGSYPQTVLLILSILTIFTGSMLACKEKLLKKRLAYSSVSQLSYVIFALALMTEDGLCAALLQVLFHACAKVGLFLCAGGFICRCGTHYVDELRGMGRRMPGVTAAFTCLSLSLIGIPPFGGFISKWQIAAAALSQGSPAAGIGLVILMLSAFLTAAYLLPIVSRAYFPGKDFACSRTDGGAAMLAPLLVLSAATAVLGLFPGGICRFFAAAAAGLF